MTRGGDDNASVALAYLAEQWTIREATGAQTNHIAEALAHIFMTRRTEHDTIPPFGGDLFQIIFEPNENRFRVLAGHYFTTAAERWEKRAGISEDDIYFKVHNGHLIDEGRLPMIVDISFITQQAAGNLVSPFVSFREARTQEYPSALFDISNQDYYSRYWGIPTVYLDGIPYNRFPKPSVLGYARDDQYYKVLERDSWLLISWKLYGDIRFWYLVAMCYIHDVLSDTAPRQLLDTTGDPEPGTMLRAPSRQRASLLIAG